VRFAANCGAVRGKLWCDSQQLDPLAWSRQSERLDARFAEYGVAHGFVSLPWATHAYVFNLAGPGGQLSTYALEWFLAAVTK
jgi:hypothetical protein